MSDSSDDDMDLEEDQKLKDEEGDKRGRKERRAKTPEKVLGKRSRNAKPEDDAEMISDCDEATGPTQLMRGSLGKNRKSMTPKQRKISVQKDLRERS